MSPAWSGLAFHELSAQVKSPDQGQACLGLSYDVFERAVQALEALALVLGSSVDLEDGNLPDSCRIRGVSRGSSLCCYALFEAQSFQVAAAG